MANKYIPTEKDKERQREQIRRTADFLNKKPLRQGSNQELDKIIEPNKKEK